MKPQSADWIQTYTGKKFWPLSPRVEDIDIADIAHALSQKCRFTGHCNPFYSVAQHSVYVAANVSHEDKLWGLLHDATEAYLPDIASPIKRAFRVEHAGRLWTFDEIEYQLMTAICERFGLAREMPASVKRMDLAMLATEARDVMAIPPAPWNLPEKSLAMTVDPLSAWMSRQLFLNRFMTFSSAPPAPSPGEAKEAC